MHLGLERDEFLMGGEDALEFFVRRMADGRDGQKHRHRGQGCGRGEVAVRRSVALG